MEFKFSNGKTHKTINEVFPECAAFTDIPDVVYKYGLDFQGNKITPPDGYEIITDYCKIESYFIHFDIYGGWTKGNYSWHIERHHSISMGKGGYSDDMGRWICWAKPKSNIHPLFKEILNMHSIHVE